MRGSAGDDPHRLPDGWSWSTFSTVATIAANLVPPQEWPALPHVAPDNISRDTGRLLPYRTISEDGVTSAKHLFKPGQLLYSKIRPYLNKCVRVDFRGLCSADMYPLEAHVETAYLHSYILSRQFVSAVSEAAGSRTVLPKTNQAQLAGVPIPVAPREEQRRIAAAVDSYFTRLDDAVATLERVKRNLKRYRASVLKSAVEGRLVPNEAALAKQDERAHEPASVLLERILTERRRRWSESGKKSKYQEPAPPNTTNLPKLPDGWCWVTLNSISDIQLGQQRAPDHAAAANQIPYVRAANITWGGLDLRDVKSMGFPNPERYGLEYGDVLLSEASGSPMEAGKPAVWRDEIPGACYQKTVLRIRPFNKSLVLPEYLRAVFLQDCLTGKFARLAPGVGIVHLTAERMIEWPVPLAPIVEQRKLVAEIDRLESAIESTLSAVAKQLVRCDRLRQAILKWAFEGKLADQDPNDEPASVLLDRIKAERAATSSAKPTRAAAAASVARRASPPRRAPSR